MGVTDCYEKCAQLTASHYENFSVASWLLPATKRPHFHAVYAFCRGVDNLGDASLGNRLAQLDEWEKQTHLCYEGRPTHPYFVALAETVAKFSIPRELFLRLIEANRIDQRVSRYATFADLEHYCEYSATPVGRIVLYVLGHNSEDRFIASDATCTALQLANFWQDVTRDYEMGRIYIPLEDMERLNITEATIRNRQNTPQFKQLIRFEVEHTRALFAKGAALLRLVPGRFGLVLALFSRGGLQVLEAIKQQDYAVLGNRPTLTRWNFMTITTDVLFRKLLGLSTVSPRLLESQV